MRHSQASSPAARPFKARTGPEAAGGSGVVPRRRKAVAAAAKSIGPEEQAVLDRIAKTFVTARMAPMALHRAWAGRGSPGWHRATAVSGCVAVIRMIADAYLDLLLGPNTAVLASLLPDGTPQASPVWFWFDGERIMVSTTADRQKHRNVKRSPDVALTIVDPNQPLRWLPRSGGRGENSVTTRSSRSATPSPASTASPMVERSTSLGATGSR